MSKRVVQATSQTQPSVDVSRAWLIGDMHAVGVVIKAYAACRALSRAGPTMTGVLLTHVA